jgi:RHS repeat-associated protein
MEEERFARLNHRDSETGLDPTHFRMYASGQGRWLRPDLRQGQALNPQSFNRYSYVLGNPANRIDPRGLCGCYPGYDEFDYLLDFGFVPDYGNYGCGCSPFGCGYPLLPPIGVVVFGGGGGEVAAGGVYIPPTPIDYVARSSAPSAVPPPPPPTCADKAIQACKYAAGPIFVAGLVVEEGCIKACAFSGLDFPECVGTCLAAGGVAESVAAGACLAAAAVTYLRCKL